MGYVFGGSHARIRQGPCLLCVLNAFNKRQGGGRVCWQDGLQQDGQAAGGKAGCAVQLTTSDGSGGSRLMWADVQGMCQAIHRVFGS